jgi:hypothetical protein
MVRGGWRLKTDAPSPARNASQSDAGVVFALPGFGRLSIPPQFFVSPETFCCNFGQEICTLRA